MSKFVHRGKGEVLFAIRTEITAADVKAIAGMHGRSYHQERGWNKDFEFYVAAPLSEFALRKNARERIWIVEQSGALVGSIAVVECSVSEAQLRWFLVALEFRGKGLGSWLLEAAIVFARASGYARLILWTVEGLAEAGRLYQKAGFKLGFEKPNQLWGQSVIEQRFDLEL